MNDLVRRAVAVNQAHLALGHEVFAADDAVLVRNRSVPDIRDANHMAHVTAATTDEIDRLLARVKQEFAGIPHRMFNLDPDTPPPLEARLVLDGYERRDQLIMVLDGMLVGVPRSYDLEPIVDERGW